MKSKIILSMASCLVASMALAQGSSDESTTQAPATKATKPAASTSEADVAAQPGGESTASLATNVEKPKRFGLGLSTRSDANAKSVNQAHDASILQVQRLTLSYKLDDVQTINARGEYTYTNATAKREGKSKVSDSWVGYMNTKVATLPGDWNVSAIYRQYLPTGEESRFVNKRLGMEFLYVFAEKSVGKFDFGAHINPYYFNNTQDYFYSSSGALTPNPDFEVDGFVAVGYNITPKLSVSHSFGSFNLWYRGIPAAGVARENYYYNETSLEFHPTKQITLSASVENDAQLESNNAAKFYEDGDTTYRALIGISI